MDEYYLDNLKKLYNNVTKEVGVVVLCFKYLFVEIQAQFNDSN